MTDQQEKMAEKIRKLLAKAQDSAVTAEEAASYAAMAARLALQYNVDMNVARKSAGMQDEAISESNVIITCSATDRPAYIALVSAVAGLYGLQCNIFWRKPKNEFRLVGKPSSFEVATSWTNYLAAASKRDLKRWKAGQSFPDTKAEYRASRDYTTAYCLAVARRLAEKLHEMKSKGVDEGAGRNALVVVDYFETQKRAIDAWNEQRGRTRQAKFGHKRGFDYAAARDGRAAGERVGLQDQLT